MAQHVPRVSAYAEHGRSAAGAASIHPDWLCLLDPASPFDLGRLFPDLRIRAETSPAAFVDALALEDPFVVVLGAPPARAADVELVAAWLREPGRRAVLLSEHEAAAARLHALERAFTDVVDVTAEPMEVVGRLSIAGRRQAFCGHGVGSRSAAPATASTRRGAANVNRPRTRR